MADIYVEIHNSCRCYIKDSGEWIFGSQDPTPKGNPSPCPDCKRLGDAHNRRLGFGMNSEFNLKFSLDDIKLTKLNGDCNC